MLYLVTVEIKKLPDIPVKDFFGYVIKEWEYFLRMEKRGRVLAGGKLAGRRGAAAIFDVDANSEIEEMITHLPLFPFFTDIEVTPLVEVEKSLTDAKRFYSLLSKKEEIEKKNAEK